MTLFDRLEPGIASRGEVLPAMRNEVVIDEAAVRLVVAQTKDRKPAHDSRRDGGAELRHKRGNRKGPEDAAVRVPSRGPARPGLLVSACTMRRRPSDVQVIHQVPLRRRVSYSSFVSTRNDHSAEERLADERLADEVTASDDKSLRGAAKLFVEQMLRDRALVKRELEEARERIRRGSRLTKHRFDI